MPAHLTAVESCVEGVWLVLETLCARIAVGCSAILGRVPPCPVMVIRKCSCGKTRYALSSRNTDSVV